MRCHAHRAVAGLFAMACGCALADLPWSLRLPPQEAVAYRGVVHFDNAGVPGSGMLYPAPNAAGLLAAVITHGLLVESHKATQKKTMQDAADKVLAPYRPMLDSIRHSDLMQKALQKTMWGSGGKLIAASDARGTGWLVESAPVYAMTQDLRALVLDNNMSLYHPGESGKPVAVMTIRVVSQPRSGDDPGADWAGQEGAALKEESANLLAHSLELALRDVSGAGRGADQAFKTVRYPEGTTERMERAQIVGQPCERQVLRTLRGWLMSVPIQSSEDPQAACIPALPGWK